MKQLAFPRNFRALQKIIIFKSFTHLRKHSWLQKDLAASYYFYYYNPRVSIFIIAIGAIYVHVSIITGWKAQRSGWNHLWLWAGQQKTFCPWANTVPSIKTTWPGMKYVWNRKPCVHLHSEPASCILLGSKHTKLGWILISSPSWTSQTSSLLLPYRKYVNVSLHRRTERIPAPYRIT